MHTCTHLQHVYCILYSAVVMPGQCTIHIETEILYELLTKITAALSKVALSYNIVRGLYFLAVIFAATLLISNLKDKMLEMSLEFIARNNLYQSFDDI